MKAPSGLTIPLWSVLDEETRSAIALCWYEHEAQRIVDALNAFHTIRDAGGRIR
jgi:hypothetical protein